MMEEFNYAKAMEELEAIAVEVEKPEVGIDQVDKYLKRSEELVKQCRDYLRSVQEKLGK